MRNTSRRMILVPLLTILAVLAIAGGIGYWIYDSYTYYRTDDALVTGKIVSVFAPATGQLTSLSIKEGDKVIAGQTIGTITAASGGSAGGTPSSLDRTSPMNGTIVQLHAVQ